MRWQVNESHMVHTVLLLERTVVTLNHRPQILWRVILRHPLPQEPTPIGYGRSHRAPRVLRGVLWNTWTVVSEE